MFHHSIPSAFIIDYFWLEISVHIPYAYQHVINLNILEIVVVYMDIQ